MAHRRRQTTDATL